MAEVVPACAEEEAGADDDVFRRRSTLVQVEFAAKARD
jgi:hypothetical protein